MTALLAGHLCLDLSPALPTGDTLVIPGELVEVGPLGVALGGSAANTGRALHARGVPVRIAAAVGVDALGGLVRDLLHEARLDATQVVGVADAGTSYSVVIEPPGRDRTFWHHPGANDRFDADAVRVDDADVLHVGYPSLLAALRAESAAPLVRMFARAREAGIATSLDLAVIDPESAAARVDWRAVFRGVLPLTDVFTPSAEDLISALGRPATSMDLAEQFARDAIAAGAGIVMISEGPRGLLLATAPERRLRDGGATIKRLGSGWGDQLIRIPAAEHGPVITTNGAGDAATAGLLAAIHDGTGPREAVEAAARTAAAHIDGTLYQPSTN